MNLKDNNPNKRVLMIMAKYKKNTHIRNSMRILKMRIIQTLAVAAAAVLAVAVMIQQAEKTLAVAEQQFQQIKINNIIDKSFSNA